MSTQQPLILSLQHASIQQLTFNRPKALNALNADMLRALETELQAIAQNTQIRAVVLTGAGDKAFIAGADIKHMQHLSTEQAQEFAALGHRVFNQIEQLPQPVIAAVNGIALGGGTEIALACDIIYAAEHAIFGQPEVKLGLIPGFGGTQRLPRKIPPNLSRELIFTGQPISAQEALRVGLANKVFSADQLLEQALNTANLIAQQSPNAVALAKTLMRRGQDQPLPQALQSEVSAFSTLFNTPDPKEGIAAFLEKRSPEFPPRQT